MQTETISQFQHAGASYQLNQPLAVELDVTDGLWVYHSAAINLWGYGETREDALSDLHENFAYLWREFASERDEALDDQARQIKQRLLQLVNGHSEKA